jgi:hypothetical protein
VFDAIRAGTRPNNTGHPVPDARNAAVKGGITINGWPITWIEPGLDLYYRDNVIGGPGAFVISIDDYENFANAILNKLVTEIAGVRRGNLASAAPR